MTIFLVLLAIVVVIAVVMCVSYYNGFIIRRNAVNQAYSTIDVVLLQRSDLVPNLVATVERYMKHEAETFTRITALRARAMDKSANLEDRVAADSEINRLIGNIMLQVENYPELKADKHFQDLFSSLEMLEGQIAASRRTFNAAVTGYNNSIQMFPGNLFAGIFGFKARELLQATSEQRENPSVKKLFGDS